MTKHAGVRAVHGAAPPRFRAAMFVTGSVVLVAWTWARPGGLPAQEAAPEVPPGEELPYEVTDPALRVVRIDSDETESFLAVRLDSAGRLYVGAREGLFVYEPARGGFGPRQELYRFPPHTWVYDIAVRGHDLYVLTTTALYVFRDATLRREGLEPQRLVWGIPLGHVHQCFHGLAWGPEGDLYISSGDPLWYYGDFNRPDHWGYWTFFSQPEGTRTPYNGVGGIFRVHPDGTGFEVVAEGTRNSNGLAFDAHWNLFTNDNDHEQMPSRYVPGRLLHVTPRAYFSWPRGWMLEKTPDRADLVETMFGGMGRAVPVGQAYYDESYLPEAYRNNLLIARWGIRAVTRYPLERHGATFRCEEHRLLVGRDDARPVGVAVGPCGRIFVTICYMAHNDNSPVYRSDLVMITRADDTGGTPVPLPSGAGEGEYEPYDAPSAALERLWQELSSPSWQRRSGAHVELLRRGGEVLDEAVERLARAEVDSPAREHLLWLAAASGRSEAGSLLVELARGPDAGVRLQAVRALGEFRELGAARQFFIDALDDEDPQVRLAALLALFRADGPVPREVIDGPARSGDTYLRQAAARLLAGKASLDELMDLCRSEDTATRLAGVLAAGFRLTMPPVNRELPEALPLEPHRSDEVYVIAYADATVDLREFGRVGNYTVADHWNAAPHTEEQERLFELLVEMLDDGDDAVRLQAGYFLSLLNDGRSEGLVAEVRRDVDRRRLEVAPFYGIGRAWLAGPFDDGGRGFEAVHAPERGAVDLTAEYETAGGNGWQEAAIERLYNFAELIAPAESASYYAYFRLESAARQTIVLLVGSDDGVKVWHNGREVWANDTSRGALPFQDEIELELEPGSNDFLVRVRNREGACALYLHYRSLAEVVAGLPARIAPGALEERLRAAAEDPATEIAPEFLEIDWSEALAEGDAARGRALFEELACARCHAVATEGPSGAPSLADARQRFTVPYMVESILLPSAQVSPLFRASTIATTDGEVLTGLIVGETADEVELLLSDGMRRTIAKSQIEERQVQEVSPMPGGVVRAPEELRDLLAYLLSEGEQ